MLGLHTENKMRQKCTKLFVINNNDSKDSLFPINNSDSKANMNYNYKGY